jgi:hypothetical protein
VRRLAHGGGQGSAKRNARERLLAAVDPAISVLVKALRKAEKENNYDASSIRAALGILDRTGHARELNVTGTIDTNVNILPPTFNVDLLDTEQKLTLIHLLELCGAIPASESHSPVVTVLATRSDPYKSDPYKSDVRRGRPDTAPALGGDTLDDWSTRQLVSNDPPAIETGPDDYAVL